MPKMGFLSVSKITLKHKIVTNFLLCSIILSNLVFLAVPLHYAFAAQTTVDAAVSTATTEHTILGSASVFVTDQIGYKFYVNSTGACVYSKTVNAGANWSIEITIDSDTTCFGATVWYDRWTPGDAGNYIHILTADTTDDDLWYNRLDTVNDELLLNSIPVSVSVNTAQGGTIAAGSNNGSITKGTDGTIYAAMNDNTDRYVVECSGNCGAAASWTETGTTPMDAQPDYSLLMPLPAGDILLINRDVSADDLRSKVWDDSVGSWSGAWTTINANALENATYDPGFAATVDPNTGDIYLAYIDWATTGTLGGNNDDVRTATYSGGAWANNTDVITNTARGLTGVAVGVDANTSNVYVGYTGQTTAGTAGTGRVYWKSSADGMTTWGAENGPVNTLAEDIYGVDINNVNYQRLGLSWYGATNDDMYIEAVMADLVPTTEVYDLGLQNPEIRASTTDFYIGGAFVIDENVASRNVTSITITENGTISASSSLDNIELRYDLDTSAPYDCASESYGGAESQFGSTDTNGFSADNGTSAFTGSVAVSATQTMCVYVVVDVLKSATPGQTIDIEIANPATDVVVSGGVTAVPLYAIRLLGDTDIKFDTDFRVQRGVIYMNADTETLTAGIDYDAPISADRAFIRITNTGHTGAGPDLGSGTRNADDVTVQITNPANIMSSITFQRGTGAINTTRVSWEIVEYKGVSGGDNEFVVRKQEAISYTAAGTTVTNTAASGIVDDNDVAVFITSQYNANTGATVYHYGLSTAAWNAGADTVTLTRGAGGSVSTVSYAVVEFTGSNWKIQRIQHTYTAVGTTETEAMNVVNSLSRAFVHVQKRAPSSTHANFGQEVWLSGIGQVSFLLSPDAATPASHVAVAWVVENTQTLGTPMDVTRSNGAYGITGVSPQTNIAPITPAVDDLAVTSIFVNNRATTTNNTWPEPILGIRILSNSTYEIWRSDITASVFFRTEIVEWPTAQRKIEQNYYRLYVDNNALTPTDPWPSGAANLGENAELTADDGPLALGDNIRIRMTLLVKNASIPAGAEAFNLQFAPRVTTCGAIGTWYDIGDSSSTTAPWRGVANTPVDGTAVSTDPPTGGDLLISVASVAGTYEEANPTAVNSYAAFPSDQVEYDWVIEHNGADDKTNYCFRMVESSGTLLTAYNYYPVVRTVGFEPVVKTWRWYGDETNLTPTLPLAGENVAPIEIPNDDNIKLRLTLEEISGAAGNNNKFIVQYSEYADFSKNVFTLTGTTTCAANSIWCYADGAGVDNQLVPSAVISDADSCVGGVGTGCGIHNESTSTVKATFDQGAFTTAEYEFTIKHAGARANAVYYFRLYDVTTAETIGLGATSTYPSLVTEGAQLVSTLSGVNSGTTIAGIVTDVNTTPTSIGFGSLLFNTSYEAAQQIEIDTNATEGYQLMVYSPQQLVNSYGDPIPAVAATNATPLSWASSCSASAIGCFGYHTTDATLGGGSGRFAPDDSYAAFDTTPREIMYSSAPANDTYHLIFRAYVTEKQPAGDYTTDITYLSIPVF
ncbi:MAG: hypothetical protein KBC35_00255 [Candidatus Pacebacteria bacterium]|nr:hypothetical protein [Candidatus Paceibacterota bacterium]